MAWNALDDMDLAGKTVLTRVDINVPIENGQVSDATRIERIVPTVKHILAQGGKPVLLAHFGRPKGKVVPEMSLEPLVPTLAQHFDAPVRFASDCVGPAAKDAVVSLKSGEVLLLENTRFHPEETANDEGFSAQMAELGDVYVNDAFSAAHRAHASTEGLARKLPAAAGRLMEAELKALETALCSPARPVGAIVGGAKVSTKIDLLSHLVTKLDVLIIGGGMANTFLMAQGAELGASLVEGEMLDTAREILAKAASAGCQVVLPADGMVATAFAANAPHLVLPLGNASKLDADQMVLDAGPDSITACVSALSTLKTLIWNGPMGAFEIEPFDTATVALAKAAARMTQEGQLVTVAGGGDTVAALNQAGAAGDFTYISTAGGAFLEWMEGKTLPGVAALEVA